MPAMPVRPAVAFQAFSTEWAVSGESQMARTTGPAPDRHAPAAPIWYALLDQLGGAGEKRQAVRLVQPIVHGGPQQGGVRGEDGRGQQGGAAGLGRRVVVRDAGREGGPHVRRVALGLGDEQDRDPGLRDPEAAQDDLRPRIGAGVRHGQREAAVQGRRDVVGMPFQPRGEGQQLVGVGGQATGAGAQQQPGQDGRRAASQAARGGDHAAHLDPPRGVASRRPDPPPAAPRGRPRTTRLSTRRSRLPALPRHGR